MKKCCSLFPMPSYATRQLQYCAAGALILCTTCNLQASELDVIMAEQEQQILHLAEQKRQLQVLNNLLPPLQELAAYPHAAIRLLIDHNKLGRLSQKDKELLKKVIQILRLESLTAKGQPVSEVKSEPVSEATNTQMYRPVQSNFGLTTLFAIASNRQNPGTAVFQLNDSQQSVMLHIGQSFEHLGSLYRLLDIQVDSDGFIKQFLISLQTPQGIRKYRWPE